MYSYEQRLDGDGVLREPVLLGLECAEGQQTINT